MIDWWVTRDEFMTYCRAMEKRVAKMDGNSDKDFDIIKDMVVRSMKNTRNSFILMGSGIAGIAALWYERAVNQDMFNSDIRVRLAELEVRVEELAADVASMCMAGGGC